MRYRWFALWGIVVGIFGASSPVVAQIPIPHQEGALPVPIFIGQRATPYLISAPAIPVHPFMGSAQWANTHNDSYMSDTYSIPGPLGVEPMTVRSSFLGIDEDSGALCVTVTFDSQGRIVTVSSGYHQMRLYLLDPDTLQPMAKYDFPDKSGSRTGIAGGGYFYLDQNDRAIVPVGREIQAFTHDDSSFTLDQTFDLVDFIPEDDAIGSTLPDFDGRLWFLTKGGWVGVIDTNRYPTPGSIAVHRLEGEIIENSFAIDETGGVFVVSDHAIYRIDVDSNGVPIISWREEYDRGTQLKPSQFSMGSGTTPTLMGSQYVTITDNADPYMHVLVYRRAKTIEGDRLVSSIPVFQANRGATENSLIATDRSIIVENNYGYSNAQATTQGKTTESGMTRIDLDENGDSHIVWTREEHIPSVISKMSLAIGLIYTYTKDVGPETTDAWYLTAIDFETGKTVFKQLAGTGFGYNNHYAGIYLGPDEKTLYVGVVYGLIAIRDHDPQSGYLGWDELHDACGW